MPIMGKWAVHDHYDMTMIAVVKSLIAAQATQKQLDRQRGH
jgi:hypothetical protein